ncbi:hypothetical protein GGER_16100 [Serratia rubidaea]
MADEVSPSPLSFLKQATRLSKNTPLAYGAGNLAVTSIAVCFPYSIPPPFEYCPTEAKACSHTAYTGVDLPA